MLQSLLLPFLQQKFISGEKMREALALVFVFQFKHFVCDFPLQTPYMLRKFLPGWAWVLPLSAHALVHAVSTFVISCCFSLYAKNSPAFILCLSLALLDFCSHFVMDRIKASPNLLGRFKMLSSREYPDARPKEKRDNSLFWISLGVDQFWHHTSDLCIIFVLLSCLG
jgi:hypothetical protein